MIQGIPKLITVMYILSYFGVFEFKDRRIVFYFLVRDKRFFLSSKGSRPAWGTNQTSQHNGTGALSTGVKLRACGGDHSPPFIPKLRMCVAESRLLPVPLWLSLGKLHLLCSPFVFMYSTVLARM
jgi:hypothetical protein